MQKICKYCPSPIEGKAKRCKGCLKNRNTEKQRLRRDKEEDHVGGMAGIRNEGCETQRRLKRNVWLRANGYYTPDEGDDAWLGG